MTFLQQYAGDVHIINHAFPYVHSLVEQLGVDRIAQLRLVGICHTDQEYYYANLERLAPVLQSIVCVSDTCASTLAARIPEHAHKLVVLPAWAVTMPDVQPPVWDPATPLRLLYTGRIVQYQKRVLDLVQLAVALRQLAVDAELTIVGAGPDLELLRAALHKAEPDAIPVTIASVRPPWEMEPVLRSHHALVQVSEFEGASVSLMEALAHGLLPMVTATRSGHELLAPGRNAITAPVGDMRELAASIAALFKDPPRFGSMREAAMETARSYLSQLAYGDRFGALVRAVSTSQPITSR
jgi:glycosyltransferase involved in cell wall biosynthesis